MLNREKILEYLEDQQKMLMMDVKRPIKAIVSTKDFRDVEKEILYRSQQLAISRELEEIANMLLNGEFDSWKKIEVTFYMLKCYGGKSLEIA